MINGERPAECSYCWKIEDTGENTISDRVFKSIIYNNEDLEKAAVEYSDKEDVNLKTLEISFDSKCNFACSYCGPGVSTTWKNDIIKNGDYKKLNTDKHDTYAKKSFDILKNEDENEYLKAFWKWWEADLQYSLQELRITGGEVLMSNSFWKLIEYCKNSPKKIDMQFAINTNLGVKKSLIKRICEDSYHFKNFHLYTSNESVGKHAEYIRDGLIWNNWMDNLIYVKENSNTKTTHIMMTINALCLYSITEFMDEMIKIKKEYKNSNHYLSLNILNRPEFHSVLILPKKYRLEHSKKIRAWLKSKIKDEVLEDFEIDSIKRLCLYLERVDNTFNGEKVTNSYYKDFKNFYIQYDKRRGKDFLKTFPELTNFWNYIKLD